MITERINRVRKEKGWKYLARRAPQIAAERTTATIDHYYRKARVSVQKNPRKIVTVDGNKFRLDKNDSLELSVFGIYEPFETSLIQEAAKPGMVALDIGANIGYYVLQIAKRIEPSGHLYAFEPGSENLAVLQENIQNNDYTNVTVEKKAVSNKAGVLKLFLAADNLADHHTYETPGRKSVSVPMITIDSYLKGKTVDLIKVDIQGAEGLALEGMRKTLKKSKKLTMFLEFWPNGMRAAGFDPQKAWDILVENGFKIQNIRERERKIEPIDFETIERDYPDGTNLLCTK